MRNPPDDEHTTTATLKKIAPGLAWFPRVLRERLTPAAAWTGIAALFGSAFALYDRSTEIPALQSDVRELQHQEQLLQGIKEQLAVMNTKLDMNTEELNRQREWRERIEEVAEHRTVHRKRVQ